MDNTTLNDITENFNHELRSFGKIEPSREEVLLDTRNFTHQSTVRKGVAAGLLVKWGKQDGLTFYILTEKGWNTLLPVRIDPADAGWDWGFPGSGGELKEIA